MYDEQRQQQGPTVKYIPPTVISGYLNQWITTSIPGYGRVTAYVIDYNQATGMVSLFIYAPPMYQQQFIQVHHSDLVGIAPYFGPTPPQPSHPTPGPQPGPWWPGHGPRPRPQPRPPHGQGGGFLPWLWGQLFP